MHPTRPYTIGEDLELEQILDGDFVPSTAWLAIVLKIIHLET